MCRCRSSPSSPGGPLATSSPHHHPKKPPKKVLGILKGSLELSRAIRDWEAWNWTTVAGWLADWPADKLPNIKH